VRTRWRRAIEARHRPRPRVADTTPVVGRTGDTAHGARAGIARLAQSELCFRLGHATGAHEHFDQVLADALGPVRAEQAARVGQDRRARDAVDGIETPPSAVDEHCGIESVPAHHLERRKARVPALRGGTAREHRYRRRAGLQEARRGEWDEQREHGFLHSGDVLEWTEQRPKRR
jgi:hypothetical protein